MAEDRNQNQIIRKDARNCFVESLCDAFEIGRIHLAFATYDLSKPAGELRYMLQNKKKSGDKSPLYQCLGGTSAEKLAKQGRSRKDGKSLSRTAQLLCGSKSDFLFVADSGPGQTDAKGLIVPRFGNKPENHVAISMTFEVFSELMLLTKAHFEAWLSAWYMQKIHSGKQEQNQQQANFQYQESGYGVEYASDPIF